MLGIDGCQTTSNFYYDASGKYIEITNPPEQCVLYRVLKGNAEFYRAGLFTANYAALKAGIYKPSDALDELDNIEKSVLDPGATVGSVLNTLILTATAAAKVGAPELILVTEGLGGYRGNMTPLDDCTRYKLINFIGGQKNLVRAFGK